MARRSLQAHAEVATAMAMVTVMVMAFSMSIADAQNLNGLKYKFYKKACPRAEQIVEMTVRNWTSSDSGLAAGLLRMHFHDCFVRGCEASVLLDGTDTEKTAPPNNPSLRGYEVIDSAKAQLESVCPKVVSCADIVAYAARDSSYLTGLGVWYAVPAGRRDGRVSLASETRGNLPPGTANVTTLTEVFSTKGLSQDEMVVLSGSHSIGRAHCTSIVGRLYNFSGTGRPDSKLNKKYVAELRKQCPENPSPSSFVDLERRTPTVLDNLYYSNIRSGYGLLTSDDTLRSTGRTAKLVGNYALNRRLWATKFAKAMVKMGTIGVLTGSDGEIRTNCRQVN